MAGVNQVIAWVVTSKPSFLAAERCSSRTNQLIRWRNDAVKTDQKHRKNETLIYTWQYWRSSDHSSRPPDLALRGAFM
jgi:hypothetical protein